MIASRIIDIIMNVINQSIIIIIVTNSFHRTTAALEQLSSFNSPRRPWALAKHFVGFFILAASRRVRLEHFISLSQGPWKWHGQPKLTVICSQLCWGSRTVHWPSICEDLNCLGPSDQYVNALAGLSGQRCSRDNWMAFWRQAMA